MENKLDLFRGIKRFLIGRTLQIDYISNKGGFGRYLDYGGDRDVSKIFSLSFGEQIEDVVLREKKDDRLASQSGEYLSWVEIDKICNKGGPLASGVELDSLGVPHYMRQYLVYQKRRLRYERATVIVEAQSNVHASWFDGLPCSDYLIKRWKARFCGLKEAQKVSERITETLKSDINARRLRLKIS